ncbi:nitrous oxide reductase family maturation protein NosD [Niveibacterium microcysteis]|uniref:Nitrous oxide reductase family maturation protein NosD n=1 Tax=Niveibacterium microcysteis TaxID=2811415 RepID=A0ABX7M9P2_9RHOO|nr:nitrous oxide reductase family maturation protein NosD [Niveibacterium microcysteis]QSI77458.1 nitrous oxide reductase family maturation protein NosD [Niveibacterium microcysteis]
MCSALRIAFLSITLLLAGTAAAAELHVAAGESIAAAIVRAQPGDTIRVARGQYHEHLRIEKPLTLIGENMPTISGDMSGDVIRIVSPDVRVEGFVVRDSGDDLAKQQAGIYIQPGAHRAVVRNNQLAYNLFGLWIEKANDVVVEKNRIAGKRDYLSPNRGNGIQLYNTQGAKILDNHISYSRDGIYVDVSHHALFRGNEIHDSRYGTHYMNSYFNTWEKNFVHHNRGGLALMEVHDQVVRNNIAWANTDHGIMLRTIQRAEVSGNIIAGNGRGFFIYDAQDNTLTGNLVVRNEVGVHLSAGSWHNQVDGNDFIGNHEGVRYVGAKDEVWGPKAGNHWSGYLGWDRNGDGRGDVPFEAADLVDRLMWRYPAARVLLNSPAVETLRLAARQFPVLRAPTVVEPSPAMRPRHPEWRYWLERARH